MEECVDDVWPWSYLLAGWRYPSTSERDRQYTLPTLPALIDELYNSATCSSLLCLQPLHFRSLITAMLDTNYDYSVAWQFQRNLADFVQFSPENGECERFSDLSTFLSGTSAAAQTQHIVSK